MQSEWLKVMLEEIARKREEAERALEEEKRRADERRTAGGHTTAREPDALATPPRGRR